MKRKIYDELLKWKKESNGHTALLIEGARRVGKSYIVEKFAKTEYKSHILINFTKATKRIKGLFVERKDDIPMILQKISDEFGVRLYPRESLIVFDEVQKCPPARELIKFFVEDGRFDYIETGSLISIHENVDDILIPSEEEKITMHPMDFEEFCWAMGNETLVPYICQHFHSKEPMGPEMHEIAMGMFRQYMIVGGMPMPVKVYSETRNFSYCEKEKRSILKLYREDVGKKSGHLKRKVASMFEYIPSELSRHDKVFVLSDVQNYATFSKFDSALFWLEESRMVNVCFNSTEPSIGLNMNLDNTRFKCYLGDTGLLVTMAMNDDDKVEHEIYRSILMDRLHINEGMFMENMVAQMLVANGHRLFFNAFYERDRSNNRYEIDFLVRDGTKISPIEVKSGNPSTHTSLDKFLLKHPKYLGQPYVVGIRDMKKDGKIHRIPLYMAICL